MLVELNCTSKSTASQAKFPSTLSIKGGLQRSKSIIGNSKKAVEKKNKKKRETSSKTLAFSWVRLQRGDLGFLGSDGSYYRAYLSFSLLKVNLTSAYFAPACTFFLLERRGER